MLSRDNPDGKCPICERPKSRHTHQEANMCKNALANSV